MAFALAADGGGHRTEKRTGRASYASILMVLLAWSTPGTNPASPVGDTVETYTEINDTGVPQGVLAVRFSAPVRDPVVIDNPPRCSTPKLVYPFEDKIYIRWWCNCVQPGDSVTFTVDTLGAVRLEKEWLSSFGGACPGVQLKSFRVVDLNGDNDGYPDTNETVNLFVTVRNAAVSQDLTNVVIAMNMGDPKIDCIVPSASTVPVLAAGAEAEMPPFRLHVHPDADRAGTAVNCNNPGPSGTCSNFVDVAGGCLLDSDCHRTAAQDYLTDLMVTVTSDQDLVPRQLQAIRLDVDLNVENPAAPTTTYSEGFESGFGRFMFLNLDYDKASNSASDGYRCQYNDPDFTNSNSYGETACYLGFSGQSPLNDWHLHTTAAPDGGRSFAGTRSLHYGKHSMGDPDLDTSGLGQLDAIRTKSNINLAARVCRDDPAADKRACDSEADCAPVGGGPCVSANPELSFKHQISLVDSRVALIPTGQSVDRAVVYAKLGVGTGTPPFWQKLTPYQNVHDAQAQDSLSSCSFDPTDDGNDEDDYFDPNDPDRRLGPSSTCFPELAFSYQGDTWEAYGPMNVGRASDPPGLAGSLGPGTWVESKFDLSRYRGRSIQLRFVVTSVEFDGSHSYQNVFAWNPTPVDDGWYLDDIRLTQTLGASSPTSSLDTTDNSGLPGNLDGDARGDDCDCAPADPGAFARPTEVDGLKHAADKVTLNWESAKPAAGLETVHDVLRGALDELPVGSGSSELCLASGIEEATVSDPATAEQGRGFWYLVRARNDCGLGTYGFQSNGIERASVACP